MRSALVTGGSKGIGRAMALALTQSGFQVMICARRPETLRRASRELDVLAVSADVTRDRDVKRLAREVRQAFGRLDVLVNNAGEFENFQDFARTSLARWRQTLEANLVSVVRVTLACLPLLRDGGRVVNVASTFGIEPPERAPDYAAAKAGVISLTKFLAQELAPRRITVNAIAPGPVLTASWEKEARRVACELKTIVRRAGGALPLKRMGKPEEIAAAMEYLVGASWVTGTCLVVDGGQLLR